ncbi:MAG: hypothetical protein AAGK00_01545 [Pseudomonadota bacterium]
MTDDTTAETVAAVREALDRLVDRLEREYAWVLELRADLDLTERTCQRLLASCDAAIQTLPRGTRLDYQMRCAKVRLGPDRPGRPPADGRQRAMLGFLSGKLDENVTNAELRILLKDQGFDSSPQYVSNQLRVWAAEGMLKVEGHGVYRVSGRNEQLRRIRLRERDEGVRTEMAKGRAAAEARHDAVEAENARKLKEIEEQRLRRRSYGFGQRPLYDPKEE